MIPDSFDNLNNSALLLRCRDDSTRNTSREVEKRVRSLMADLGLFFGALDFAVTPEGRWVFFEVNPNGQWHWLAVKAGVPLVEAMADALQGETA
ncbi:hypothetical protein [Streptomyces sp. Je 1-369]|uniref:hypothetical protein n=1 Tax=Streptomyces sp. Je 1-369 TaxID=2966192 RepID=UPI0022857BC5|nr:hypothetical protein [Streptomyces sp. Je 1-369]WAL96271.1 hypothetical protein NOO62_18330 [Streptomyces sp. Je 1-369]